MPLEANERYKKAYRDADMIITAGNLSKEWMSNGEFAQMVLSQLVAMGLGEDWDEAVKMGVIDRVHRRPMRWN